MHTLVRRIIDNKDMELVLRRDPTKINGTEETYIAKIRVVGGGDEACAVVDFCRV